MQIIFQDNSLVNLQALQAKFQKSTFCIFERHNLLFNIKIFFAGKLTHSSNVDVTNI
jgi:hypothetical protein